MEEPARLEAKFKPQQRVIITPSKGIPTSNSTPIAKSIKLYGRIVRVDWDNLRQEYVYSIDLDSGDVVLVWQSELEPDLSRK